MHRHTAHPHMEKDGSIINLGTVYSGQSAYGLIRIPPPKKGHTNLINVYCTLCIRVMFVCTLFRAAIQFCWRYCTSCMYRCNATMSYIMFLYLCMIQAARRCSKKMTRNWLPLWPPDGREAPVTFTVLECQRTTTFWLRFHWVRMYSRCCSQNTSVPRF